MITETVLYLVPGNFAFSVRCGFTFSPNYLIYFFIFIRDYMFIEKRIIVSFAP